MTINITQDNTRQESLGANGANLIHSLSELAQTPKIKILINYFNNLYEHKHNTK